MCYMVQWYEKTTLIFNLMTMRERERKKNGLFVRNHSNKLYLWRDTFKFTTERVQNWPKQKCIPFIRLNATNLLRFQSPCLSHSQHHTDKIESLIERVDWLSKSLRQTHLNAEFICFHFKSHWRTHIHIQNGFINQRILVFFRHSDRTQIKRNPMHILCVCPRFSFFFLLFY